MRTNRARGISQVFCSKGRAWKQQTGITFRETPDSVILYHPQFPSTKEQYKHGSKRNEVACSRDRLNE